MSKVKTLTKQEKRERQTMTKRILPLRDFNKVVEHDKIYCSTLQQRLELEVIRQDILGKKSQNILSKQTKELITNNIDLLCDWAESKQKCMDLTANIRIQERLISDKLNHYEEVFLPQYKRECEEMHKEFDEMLSDINSAIKKKEKWGVELVHKLKLELLWYEDLKKEEQEDEEYKLLFYKPCKRLLKAYKNLELESEELVSKKDGNL